MTIQQALEQAIHKLTQAEIQTPELDAQVLLAHVLRQTKEYLLTYFSKEITVAEKKKFFAVIEKRCDFVPVAYITGHKEFFGLDFIVNKNVLVPRPETETIVELAIEHEKKIKRKPVVIADIGTGSGCIAITIAKHIPDAEILATDISYDALTVARQNAQQHDVAIRFSQGNFLEPLSSSHIDILVTNPPYGTLALFQNNQSIKHEPQAALYTGQNGLEAYYNIFKHLAARDQQPSVIIGEFDPRQASEIVQLAKQLLPRYATAIYKDLAGLDRILILQK